MNFESRYASLNTAQKEAVDTIDGPVMVVAGPGTGKTELLSMRVANILKKTDTLPENILCLTFTESGQAAMRERLVSIIGKDAYKVAVHTFHSFGSEIINQNRGYFYNNALFQPADELRQYEMLRSIFETLPPSNPLSSMMNGEYTHLNDARSVISELKRRSALTSDELLAVLQQNEATLDVAEKLLVPLFEGRIDKTTGGKLQTVLHTLQEHAQTIEPLYQITPLAHVLVESLAAALDDAVTIHPTKPLTAWKNSWFEKDSAKQLVCKDRKRLVKLKALSFVYYEYLSRMEKAGLFDFDDMIMQVVHAIDVHDDLRFNLQEKYLYIMVDEFQDTNPAQLRILHSLTDSPINEGRPNILVVGDDDQAIYGFQGADISNILNFSDHYSARKLIVLTENYRSGAPILEASRTVITQASDRLEDRLPELTKRLHAQRSVTATTELWQAPTIEAERQALCEAISQAIAAGTPASSIAVLARRHVDIQALLPYLAHAGIPVRYEREESVLDSPVIKALDTLAQLIVALSENRHDHAEALLPEILAHPAWHIPPKALWRLSLDAHHSHKHWMEVMETTPAFEPIHAWIVTMVAKASTAQLEPLLDLLIGKPNPDTEEETTFQSPLFAHFFGDQVLTETPERYLQFLSALRTIRTRLREHLGSDDTSPSLKHFVDFIALHRRLGVSIMSHEYSLAAEAPAVQLLTAHKSKGLEFDTVYVLHSTDSAWGRSARSAVRSINYPANMPLQSGGNTVDERLRLYYVAMTRARKQLVLTYSDVDDRGKATLIADFLVDATIPHTALEKSELNSLVTTAELAWYYPLVETNPDLTVALAPYLDAFKLSATSLNAFLDVTRGGPQEFLLNNLLHFPGAKSPSASYGTAIHATLQQAQTHLLATGEYKPLEDILHDFETALVKCRLDAQQHAFYLQKGSYELPTFLNSGVLPFATTQKAEVSFKHQDVTLGAAKLTGSLDLIDIDTTEKSIIVTDYKTGKPSEAWEGGDEFTKLKLHKYRQQLLFYKLLVENSSEYGSYRVHYGQLAFIQPTQAEKSVVLSLDLTNEDIERTAALIQAVWKHIIELDLPDSTAYSPDLKGVLAFEQDLIDGRI